MNKTLTPKKTQRIKPKILLNQHYIRDPKPKVPWLTKSIEKILRQNKEKLKNLRANT